MPQLHLYVPKDEAAQLRARARAAGLSLSKYLASLVHRELATGWPKDYFETVPGSWKGELERLPQGEFEEREPL